MLSPFSTKIVSKIVAENWEAISVAAKVAISPVLSKEMVLPVVVNERTSPTLILVFVPLFVTTIVKFCFTNDEFKVLLGVPKCRKVLL